MKTEKRDKWLTAQQVASRLNWSRSKVYEKAASGYFRVYKISDGPKAGIRICAKSVERYIENEISLYALEHGILEAD